jgi:hypothetical protein
MPGKLLNPNIDAEGLVRKQIDELIERWNGETFVVATQILDKIDQLPGGEVRRQYATQLRELFVKRCGLLSPASVIVLFVICLLQEDDDKDKAKIAELRRITALVKWQDDPGLAWAFLHYTEQVSRLFHNERSVTELIASVVPIIKGQIGELQPIITTAGMLRLACPNVATAEEATQ